MPTLREISAGIPRPSRGVAGDPGLFGPASVTWHVNREVVLLAGGGRALLLQIAHPLVAAGVADHSGFDRNPWDRLWGTLSAVLDVVFADHASATVAAERVQALHARVTGVRGTTPYSGGDQDLLLWVHATVVDSALVTYERLVGALSDAAKERYYSEMRRFAGAFGLRAETLPADLGAFVHYRDATIARLEVGPDALALIPGIVDPPAPVVLQPAVAAARLMTTWLLPGRIRAQTGLPWSPAREAAARLTAACLRGVLPVIPARLRFWPHAREAERRTAPD